MAAALLLGLPVLTNLAPAAAAGPVANPDLDPRCGIDVAIIIDRSGSIGGNNDEVQGAAQALVNALVGSGSRVELSSFSTTATAESGGSPNVTSSNISAMAFHDAANVTVPLFPSSGTTNWDDGLEMVRRSPAGLPQLTVMITDGDPNLQNQTQPAGHGTGTVGSGTTDALNAAITESDLIQAGSHMFVVGVGAVLSNAVE